MRINDRGLDLIKSFEGFESHPYQCAAGEWTIGYGSTYELSGERVTEHSVPVGMDYATKLLQAGVGTAERAVTRLINVPLTENQFSALVSFTYNVGSGNLQSSTLRMLLNRKDYEDAADEFPKWRKAGGRILQGLVRRRAAERALFLS